MGGGMTDLKSWRDPLPDDDTLVDVWLSNGDFVHGIESSKLIPIDGSGLPAINGYWGARVIRWRIHNAEA